MVSPIFGRVKNDEIFFIIIAIGMFFYLVFNIRINNFQKDDFSEINFIQNENERIQRITKKTEESINSEKYTSVLLKKAILNLNLMNFKDTEDDLKILMEIFKNKTCKTKEDCDDYLNSISLYGNLYYELDVNSHDKSRQNFYYNKLLNESKRLKSKDHEIIAKILIDSEEYHDRNSLFYELINFMKRNYPNSIELATFTTLAAINEIQNEKYDEAKNLINKSNIIMQEKTPPWDSFRILNQILKYKIDLNNEEYQTTIDDLNKTLKFALMSPRLNNRNLFEINFLIAEEYRNLGNTRLASQYFKNSFDLISNHPIMPYNDFIDAGFRYLYSLIEDNSLDQAKIIANLVAEFSKSKNLIEEHVSFLIPIYYYNSAFLIEDKKFKEALYYINKIIALEENDAIEGATRDYINKAKELLGKTQL